MGSRLGSAGIIISHSLRDVQSKSPSWNFLLLSRLPFPSLPGRWRGRGVQFSVVNIYIYLNKHKTPHRARPPVRTRYQVHHREAGVLTVIDHRDSLISPKTRQHANSTCHLGHMRDINDYRNSSATSPKTRQHVNSTCHLGHVRGSCGGGQSVGTSPYHRLRKSSKIISQRFSDFTKDSSTLVLSFGR